MNQVRVIQRSLRCFAYGLIGVIPFFGFGLGWQAIQLHRQVAAETGERWQPALLHVCWAFGMVYVVSYTALFGWAGGILIFGLFLGLQAFLTRLPAASDPNREWNPARSYLFWGLWLAYAGWYASLTAVVILVLEAAGASVGPK